MLRIRHLCFIRMRKFKNRTVGVCRFAVFGLYLITSERVCDGEALTPGGRHNPSVGRLNSRGGLSRPVARGLPAASLKRSCKTKLGSAPRLSHYLLIFHAMPAGSDTPVNDAAGVLSCTDQRPDEGLVSRCCVVAQADLGGET